MTATGITIAFWAVAAALIAAALAFVLPGLLRRAARPQGETDGDAARSADAMGTARPRHRALAVLLALAIPLLAVGGYLAVGNPGALDAGGISLADIEQARTRPEAERLAQRLQAHLDRTPRDARAWVMLARLRASLDQFAAAVTAYERAIAASSRVGGDAQVLAELADVLGMASGGVLRGRPRQLAEQALLIDGRNPKALDLAGSAAYEAGEWQSALLRWEQLLALLPVGSTEYGELAAAIARTRGRAAPGQ